MCMKLNLLSALFCKGRKKRKCFVIELESLSNYSLVNGRCTTLPGTSQYFF